MMERLSRRHVVLLGVGHTNAHVLRMWKMHAPPDTDLTCISNFHVATYSGMLPAVLAGQCSVSDMELDLVPLCESFGAKLITGEVTGIDQSTREINVAGRPAIPFDVLSIGIGSVPSFSDVDVEGDSLVRIKPMQTFLDRLRARIEKLSMSKGPQDPIRVLVVGSGVAGLEIAFCAPESIRSVSQRECDVRIVTRSEKIVPDLEARTRRLLESELERRGIDVSTGRAVRAIRPQSVVLDDGGELDADVVLWATGAAPPPLLEHLGMNLDRRGFLKTDSSLRVLDSEGIFAVGDTGTIEGNELPKAGVYAVRQGPVLWENIQLQLRQQRLNTFRPQHSFMKLVNLGDGRAVGQWKGLAFSGPWVMGLKKRIDDTFMQKFQVEPGMPMSDGDAPDIDGISQQCRGCGCKLGPDVLETALNHGQHVPYEDAAEIGEAVDGKLIASTDFFSSPMKDAYLSGRIAALHCASDVIASGGRPTSALANVVLPPGDSRSQQKALSDLLDGARLEFEAMGASVVGGHTIVGPRMELGFAVVGKVKEGALIRKEHLRPGDQLYVTKPLGVGVLLAAHMRCECSGDDYMSLLSAMLERQHPWAKVASACKIVAGTDITGFGLAGHLLEMLESSKVSAVIRLSEVPALPGATAALEAGIESTLMPANRSVGRKISVNEACRTKAAYRLLFDPQTCGGLLLGVPSQIRDEFLATASQEGLQTPILIGAVEASEESKMPLTVVE